METLYPGPLLQCVEEIKVGDLIFDGSLTAAGEANLLRVTRVCDGSGNDPSRGFQAHYVSPQNPERRRLESDQPQFIWDFLLELEHSYRLAVDAPWPLPPDARLRPSPLAA